MALLSLHSPRKRGRHSVADLNSAKVRIVLVLIAVKKSAIIEFDLYSSIN